MGVPGPKPKHPSLTRHRNPPRQGWVEVPKTPFLGAPDLPAKLPQGQAWPTWVRRWWKTVSTMPHCSLWSDSDWEFAFDTAVLKAEFMGRGGAGLATEIRNRERVLGTTAAARRDARIRYVDAVTLAAVPAADVPNLDDYREL